MYHVIFFTDVTDNIASVPAIGPYKLAHVLRKQGYSCLVVNHLSDYETDELEHLINLVIGSETVLVGFSTSFMRSIDIPQDPDKPTPTFPPISDDTVFPQGRRFEDQIVKIIRSRNPKVKLEAGGCKVHLNYPNTNMDYVCLGYSEASIVNLVDHLVHGKELQHAHRNLWGVTVIDDRFAAEYSFSTEDMEWSATDVVNHKVLPIEIGRGCVFNCKFCSFPMNGKKTLDFVKHADLIRQELQHNYTKFGITKYLIVDDTFNDHEQKLDMIHDVILSLDFQPTFWAYTRLDLLHTRPDTIQQLYEIGLRSMFFGIESLNPPSAKFIGKGFNFNRSVETIRHIRSHYPDIQMHGSFIVGLPYETESQVYDTFRRLITQDIPLHSWIFRPLRIQEASSQLFASDIERKYTDYGYVKIGNVYSGIVDWTSPWMSFKTAADLSDQLMHQSRSSEFFHLEGQMMFTLATMPHYEYDTLVHIPWREFDWHRCERSVRPEFITQYKSKLLEIVNNENFFAI